MTKTYRVLGRPRGSLCENHGRVAGNGRSRQPQQAAECFAKAQTKREDGKRKLKGDRYAHGFDAATYLIHRICSTLGGGDRGGSASDARFVRPRRPASW